MSYTVEVKTIYDDGIISYKTFYNIDVEDWRQEAKVLDPLKILECERTSEIVGDNLVELYKFFTTIKIVTIKNFYK